MNSDDEFIDPPLKHFECTGMLIGAYINDEIAKCHSLNASTVKLCALKDLFGATKSEVLPFKSL